MAWLLLTLGAALGGIIITTALYPSISPHRPRNITIGFLGYFGSGGIGKQVAGAIPIAVEHVNAQPDLLPGRTLDFVAMDAGKPNHPVAIRKMTKMREDGVVAFIGPDESCASEALVAAAWYLPMLAYKCSDRKVSDKSVYMTFARTLPPSSKVSKSVIALLRHFSWTTVTLVVSNNSADRLAEEALVSLARLHHIRVAATFYLPEDYLSRFQPAVKDIIKLSYSSTRVYVLLAEKSAVVDFVKLLDELGLLASGEYVVVAVEEDEAYNPDKTLQYIFREFDTDRLNNTEPFRALLVLTHSAPTNANYTEFQDQVRVRSTQPPFVIPTNPHVHFQVPIYAGLAYDAVLIYAHALTEVLASGGSEIDGVAIFNHIRGRTYNSILGFSVRIDERGDAEGNYTLLALLDNPNGSTPSSMRPVGYFAHIPDHDMPRLKLHTSIDWIGGAPPLSEPECGFNREKCVFKPGWKELVLAPIGTCVVIVAIALFIRHYMYESKLAGLLWKADIKDIIFLPVESQGEEDTSYLTVSPEIWWNDAKVPWLDISGIPVKKAKPRIGFYRGNVVYIKHVYKKSVDLTRKLRKEMIQIREMRHENINPFIGACVDYPNICILTLFCARGSLEDVLRNKELMDLRNRDRMFMASLIADLIKGMIYLHDSDIVSHGRLCPTNCLVDSRWVLQVADFGLHEFKAGQDLPEEEALKFYQGRLWMSPELMRMHSPPARGSQKGDVYSFAIILYEMTGLKGPWGPKAPEVKCIVEKVATPCGEPYRPPIHELSCPDYIINTIRECWAEDPEMRPEFRLINSKLREMRSDLKPDIMDNMIAMMEKYSSDLMTLVHQRTNQLLEEKKKTETLLLRMLPNSVAEQLKRGEKVEAESFDSVTIYFSDIVDFTALCAVSTPLQVVELLNDLYTMFDSILENYDVYKVETIGDAYMVASGLPIRNGDLHAAQIASMALRLLDAIRTFELRHQPGEQLNLRIGIHSGPCVAGVVGLKMPRYCLFGDTVNTASRMESSGEALKIHVSEACYKFLAKIGGYRLRERGLVYIKGKGELRTYWLDGQEDSVDLNSNHSAIVKSLLDRTNSCLNLAPARLPHPSLRNTSVPMLPLHRPHSTIYQVPYPTDSPALPWNDLSAIRIPNLSD